MMEKMKMHSPNLTQENIARIRELFPGCVAEAQSEDGKPKLAVDFDQLRQELSESIVEGPQERYHLNWPGKREALLTANAPIARTLRPCQEESVDFDVTKNLFIEGDNLEALKLLQETYLGKVKMIYIDPPYNTGNDFIYEDDFSENSDEFLKRSNQKDEEGNRLIANTEANGRFHSDWLSMMYPRLKLARNLLSDDGVIFISIDDHEVHSLMRVCSEIFGEENFIAQLAVQLNPRGRHLDKFVAKTHESILIFVKDAMNENAIYGIEKEGRMVDEYNREDERGKYRLLGLRNRNQSFNPTTRPKLYYPLFVNPNDGSVSLIRDDTFTDEVWPDAPDGTKTCWTWGKEKVTNESILLTAEKTADEWRIYRKDYLVGADGELAKTLVKSVWMTKEITNDQGRKVIKDLFGSAVMDFPKSTELLKTLIQIGTNGKDLVLDFFAGSATTAHAVINQNAEDGGHRKFIMVQLPEPCDEKSSAYKAGFQSIAELSKERIRRAGKKSIEGEYHEGWNKDIGFRVLKVDSSNMADVYYRPDAIEQGQLKIFTDNIKSDRKPEDLLFQVLLDWGVDLSLPIRKETVQGKTVFFVNEPPYDLVACFDTGVSEDLVKELARFEPLRVVFRDTGFVSDAVKINVEQIFKQMSPGTEVKAI
ncbi:site-specific DNA-methyltransferase [Desulfuromonas thiophila]|uniref:site-specific DNA-methyltransferase (adenine-specific) n=1 Tax=Desulfuromonas thiophila TaxID=57664 RepID=A0A1G7DWJ8_9BACT|nr:site-specific DNA-methyltransferase [Desulfuromonas thiophila]SDE55838.1 adenine-specific DNA-methyltransferase [Desulfuromonas thiophila]